jgi:phage terminase large subunit
MHLTDLYNAYARQKQFHESPAKYRLFGGAAGPGKTKALLWEAILQAGEVKGSDTLLLRRTYPELEASLLSQFRRDVPSSEYKSYNEAKHLVTWKNGSTTRFGYCRNESDVYQYQGAEFLFIGVDELTHFTLKQWQFLTSRNRCPVPGSVCSMAGATNPGNIGHAWVKALWVDKVPPAGYDRPELYDPSQYDFIRARMEDNSIFANDDSYRRTLETLPENLRRAFLDGDWNVFAGQYFDLFEIDRHTVRPEAVRLESWWPRWISIDWGFQHPSAVYWHCAIPGRTGAGALPGAPPEHSFAPNDPAFAAPPREGDAGRIVTYREFVQPGLSPRMLGQAIAERCGRERISEIFLSPDAFAHRTAEASIAEQLGEIFAMNGLPRPSPADDDRIGGWQLMYQLLESDSWVITDNCRKLIECLPHLVRDEGRTEDIRKVDGDDPADAARYGLVSGGRLAGVGAGYAPPRAGQSPPYNFGPYGNLSGYLSGSLSGNVSGGSRGNAGAPSAGSSFAGASTPRFVHGMPLDEQIARQVIATDPTSRAIQSQRLEAEARKQFAPKRFRRRF